MKIKIVYFIFLVPNRWESIVDEQLSSLKKLDLFNINDEIVIACVGNKDEFNKLSNFISKNYPKIEIKEYSEQNHFEYLGFKTLYEIADDDSIILYFHTKGVVSGQNNNTNNLLRPILFTNIIENYSKYILELKNNQVDIGTLFPHNRSFAFYNFFWIRGDYVKKYLPLPIPSKNRFVWEEWIGNPYSKKENIKTYSSLLGYNKITDKNQLYFLRNSFL